MVLRSIRGLSNIPALDLTQLRIAVLRAILARQTLTAVLVLGESIPPEWSFSRTLNLVLNGVNLRIVAGADQPAGIVGLI